MAEFDWNNLRAFLAVARTGRLTAAAARLRADHATVSRHIGALEGSLKARLFDRSPTGYSLTPQGERLLATAEQIEALTLTASSEVRGADLSVSGTVRIGAPEGFGSYFLAPRLAALAEAHPDLEIELVAIPGVLSLSKREADIAVALSRPREGRLVARKLTDYSLSLYGAPSYLEARPPLTTRADMSAHRFIGYIEDLLYAPELDYMDAPDAQIAVQLRSSNLIAQLRAACAGAGLCVLPDFIAASEPGLLRVLPGQVGLTRSFWLLTHADLKGLARVRAVADFITGAVQAARSELQGAAPAR
ncbi:MAG: LysR family transcriptional regulator [Proteobacteria bacterium]|nr:LysR family transcriptional regulator [Pseudomonadota bacterium]